MHEMEIDINSKKIQVDESAIARPCKRQNHNASRTGACFSTQNYELLLIEFERLRSQAKLNKSKEQNTTKIKSVTKKSKLSRNDYHKALKAFWKVSGYDLRALW